MWWKEKREIREIWKYLKKKKKESIKYAQVFTKEIPWKKPYISKPSLQDQGDLTK